MFRAVLFCDGTHRYGVPAPFFAKYMFFFVFNVYGLHYSCTRLIFYGVIGVMLLLDIRNLKQTCP